MNKLNAYDIRLRDQQLAYQLLKRKLRTSLVRTVVRTLRPKDLRNIYHSIYQERPVSGAVPTIEAIPHSRKSFLYMALFTSIYRSASRVDIKINIDVDALIFAWDFFCQTFPGHVRDRRPYGRIRPANFDEAWVIAEAVKNGTADLQFCSGCKRNYFIIHGSLYFPVCQVCIIDNKRVMK